MSIATWLDEATPDRREVSVCFDRRLMSKLIRAKEQLKAFENDGMLSKSEAQRDLESLVTELEDEVRTKSRTLAFEGLGWGPWRDLLSKHPPAVDQVATFKRAVELAFMPHSVENIAYNAETFIPAAIASSCSEPGMTIVEADKLLRTAPPGVIERIWTAVLEANLAGTNDPFVDAASAAS